jgi:hypothetical protein
MTYNKMVRTINETFGNLQTTPAQAAAKLRKAARYADKLAKVLESAERRAA